LIGWAFRGQRPGLSIVLTQGFGHDALEPSVPGIVVMPGVPEGNLKGLWQRGSKQTMGSLIPRQTESTR